MGTIEKKKIVPVSIIKVHDYTHIFYVYSYIKAIPERRVAGNLLIKTDHQIDVQAQTINCAELKNGKLSNANLGF